MARPKITVIIAAYNAAATLGDALTSVEIQTYNGEIEVSVYDDSSTDTTSEVLLSWQRKWQFVPNRQLSLLLTTPSDLGTTGPHGPGYARNRAAAAATGDFLCFLDADDVCEPDRMALQLARALASPKPQCTLVGGGFTRIPADATPVYTAWCNGQIDDHAALSSAAWREVSLIQPTWFMAAAWFRALGGYEERPPALMEEGNSVVLYNGSNKGSGDDGASDTLNCALSLRRHAPILGRLPLKAHTSASVKYSTFPEDTVFLHRHLAAGGLLARVPERILQYRYSSTSQSWSTSRETLVRLKTALWEERVLWGVKPPLCVAGTEREGAGDAASSSSSTSGDGTSGGCRAVDDTTRTTSPTAALIEPLPFPGAHGAGAWQSGFTLWGCGRDGKAVYKALSPAGRALVRAFAEIDPKKVGNVYPLKGSKEQLDNEAAGRDAGMTEAVRAGPVRKKRKLNAVSSPTPVLSTSLHCCPGPRPIVHLLTHASPPFLCCVSLDSGGEALQKNVRLVSERLRACVAGGAASESAAATSGGDVGLVEGMNLLYMM